MARYIFTAAVTAFLLLSVACSSAGGSPTPPVSPASPVMPSGTPDLAVQQAEPEGEAGHYLWGFYQVYFDPAELKYEIIPLRQAEGHWNVLKWLEQGPCTNCFTIAHIEPSGTGTILIQIAVKHPFPSPNLTGFDVRGIAMFEGSLEFPVLGLRTSDRSAGDGEVVNADGYTKLYNPSTEGAGPGGFQGYIKGKFGTVNYPNSNLNAYKRFVSDDPSNTRNAFFSGQTVTVEYEIKMPTGPFIFGYAVDASWAKPTKTPVTDPMTDFPESANSPEPWKIVVTPDPMGNGLTNYGGSDMLLIDVYDWQGKDSYKLPVAECPDLFDGTVTASFKKDFGDFVRYQAQMTNEKVVPAGEYRCLVAVEDNENDTAPEWLDLTACQIVTLEVIEYANDLPVPAATASPNPQFAEEPVTFDDDGSSDPDGGIIEKYEWDWNNDGTYEAEGAHVQHTWTSAGTYTVQFRVTDDEHTSSVLDPPLSIEILPANQPPVAKAVANPTVQDVVKEVQFDDDGSYDPDGGSIQKFEWDWDNDGAFDEEGDHVTHAWDLPGLYEVQFRVTDDEGATDTLDTPLGIEVLDTGWAITFGTATGGTSVYDVATDSDGNIYATGSTWYNCDFDPGPGESEPSEKGIFIASYDRNGNYRWAHSWSNSGSADGGYGVAVDDAGYVYITGYFGGTKDFDPGPGVDSHTADGGWDVMLLKFTWDGLYMWGRTWGHSGWDKGTGVSVGSGGDVFACGWFEGSVDFDPSISETHWHTSAGPQDSFLSAFDSGGDFLWANAWGGVDFDPYVETAYGVAGDDFGNVYVTGDFLGTADFDPDDVGELEYTASGDVDGYLASYNASTGALTWAYPFSSPGNYDGGRGVVVDSVGNVYVTGRFNQTVDFDFGPGVQNCTVTGYWDAFLAKYDWSAGFEWVRSWGNVSGFGYTTGRDLDVSDGGKVLVGGSFENTVDFDPGPAHSDWTSIGEEDVFLLTYTTDDAFQWARAWGGTERDSWLYSGVAFDPLGNAFTGGYFEGTVDFDPSDAVDEHESPSIYEAAFISKFLPDGSW